MSDAPPRCVPLTPFSLSQLKTWYPSLRKPWWTPPNWAFPVAWTALYVAMGAASWLVWRDGGVAAHPLPLALYAAQLALNWAWSPLFFSAHRLGAALLDAALQLVSIAACIGARVDASTRYLAAPAVHASDARAARCVRLRSDVLPCEPHCGIPDGAAAGVGVVRHGAQRHDSGHEPTQARMSSGACAPLGREGRVDTMCARN